MKGFTGLGLIGAKILDIRISPKYSAQIHPVDQYLCE
jgi:hypothetical protein